MDLTVDCFEFDVALSPSDLQFRRGSLEEPTGKSRIAEQATVLYSRRDRETEACPPDFERQKARYEDSPARLAPAGYDNWNLENYEPPPWNIGFSKQFSKDLDGLDRKLAGRVLEALLHIANFTMPFAVIGDTFKPLSGKLAECWRYRIGDNRLILQPKPKQFMIFVLTFASRGSVYE